VTPSTSATGPVAASTGQSRTRSPSVPKVFGLGLMVQILGVWVKGYGIRFEGLGFEIYDQGFRVQGLRLKVLDTPFMVKSRGFIVLDLSWDYELTVMS